MRWNRTNCNSIDSIDFISISYWWTLRFPSFNSVVMVRRFSFGMDSDGSSSDDDASLVSQLFGEPAPEKRKLWF